MLNGFKTWIAEKIAPQREIDEREGEATTRKDIISTRAYNIIEVVNRGVNMLVDSAAEIDYDVQEMHDFKISSTRVKKKSLEKLLNTRPNPYIDTNLFRRQLVMDMVLVGNAFIYFDETTQYMFNLPANDVEVHSSATKRIQHYVYGGKKYFPDEIIHISDNSSVSYLKGDTRLASANLTMKTLRAMIETQQNYIDGGMSIGPVFTNKDVIGRKQKQRFLAEHQRKHGNPSRRKLPMFLDGGTALDRGTLNLKEELDFDTSVNSHQDRILYALGVPPVLIQGGNNANIMPNLKLFYLTTIVPITKKISSAFEAFFGYDIKVNTSDIIALRPELKEFSAYLTSLTNNGLITVNEARDKLRKPRFEGEEYDKPRDPQNITGGSAAKPETGGRPEEEQDEDNE